jgi:peptidoglycan/xylan/chitin deacetylase (PgdA/CDA1 family)
MRRDKVLRFVIITFAVGAFIGLISGLAFGGADGSNTPKAVAETNDADPGASTDSSESTSGSSEPMTAERARTIGANEMGQVLVLMYHLIDSKETEWTRTPENFRKDIALLKAEGYYPVNIRDLASGNIDIPAGKSPVAITFDDSSDGQYRILDDGTLDPDCAVGILQAAVEAGGWRSRATFSPLIDVDTTTREIFGQPDLKREKLRNLVDWGYEIGSHTVTHLSLKKASTDEATKQLAQSQATLEELIGGSYEVTTLAVPFGEYPESDAILASGQYEDITYAYTAALSVSDGPCPSPFSTEFRALHIPRYRGSDPYLADAIAYFKQNPQLRYISDGDPMTVSAPAELDSKLGEPSESLGRPVILY